MVKAIIGSLVQNSDTVPLRRNTKLVLRFKQGCGSRYEPGFQGEVGSESCLNIKKKSKPHPDPQLCLKSKTIFLFVMIS